MSLLTTLAYAITAAVRPRGLDAEIAKIAKMKAQVDDLTCKARELRADYNEQCREIVELRRTVRDIQRGRRDTSRPLLGARNLSQPWDDFICNCVPARHDAFKGILSGD